nr:unnamed protein product [Callosobruchus analis]
MLWTTLAVAVLMKKLKSNHLPQFSVQS